MRRKQLMVLLMAAVVSQSTALMARGEVANAETETKIEVNEGQVSEVKSEYISKTGNITEVYQEGEYYYILVGTPIEGIEYVINNSEMIIDSKTLAFLQPSDLKVGMEITVIIAKNAPMTMSLPARVSQPEAMIVHSSEVNVDVSYYSEELVNEENTLQLNIERDTYITNKKGAKMIFMAEDIKNQNAMILYTNTTRSIPAQTTPKMVLILPSTDPEQEIMDLEVNVEDK
ncbi:MAG: hypothetical protein E7231_14295 [Cellulosilyticum sp.]|nr:hypothetical protein [Cellulosilyticum sp.]